VSSARCRAPRREPHAADRRQLEDAQDGRRGRGYIQALLPRVSALEGVEVAICPPFTALQAMVDSTRGSRVAGVRAEHAPGARGRVHRRGLGADAERARRHGVVLGHSERRELFGETDKALALKVPAALEAGLQPILCVGETEEERDNGDTERKLRHQVRRPRQGADPSGSARS
jgi:triosephosphate isomerase